MEQSSQPSHTLSMIPGPIEIHDSVAQAMASPSVPHVAGPFVKVFSETLKMVRQVLDNAPGKGQPLILSGGGTVGWDVVAANLIQPSEKVLVLNIGYFSDGFADCLAAYGASVDHVRFELGVAPDVDRSLEALKASEYRAVIITHVDTSTGVLSPLKDLALAIRKASPNTLIVVDGVCSVAVEEIRFDAWDLDVVLTASQKGLGAPAGLSVIQLSDRAIAAFENRTAPVHAYYVSLAKWLPVMRSNEDGKPMYFSTQAVQNILALHASMKLILDQGIDKTFAAHIAGSNKAKAAVAKLGLKQIPAKAEDQAHGLTTIYLPNGLTGPDIIPKLAGKGVFLAGGLIKGIAANYIRLGHMGVSVSRYSYQLDTALKALEETLGESGQSSTSA
ncbi:hypothetical protein CANCADRAFT_29980 [Tortispora caseinolytica NRRL Y-17796]|uniref:alanine--glyoxylate transaminase n=1 Tax=Tortispora caseinolytica NRRL Y-17796 TaxID=767744 RepID=A0A1E4TIK8_9ASCO|nr:hypothetical protein CANCADRAFT_29980 [Tortispora caseinolytica NRRL Y-17796]